MKAIFIAFLALITLSCTIATRYPLASTFKNPVKYDGPDPEVLKVNDCYYLTVTRQTYIQVWRSEDPSSWPDSSSAVVWTPPPSGDYSSDVWAPEIHLIGTTYYIYFAADNPAVFNSHRIYALRCESDDPLAGPWTFLGKIQTDPEDHFAIDPTWFEVNGQQYLSWCGQETGPDQTQVFVAKLSDPTTLSGPRMLVSRPTYPWEKITANGTQGAGVNEGPQFWAHNGKAFLTFSASDCASDQYALGLLTADINADLSQPSSWTKTPVPVLIENPAGSVYATGHNGFFKSPDLTQDWIIYHANPAPNEGCGTDRASHIQPFTYDSNGQPVFLPAVPLDQTLEKPSPL